MKNILGRKSNMESAILSRSKDILKVTFYLDLILLVASIFYSSKTFLITSLILNIILIGAYMVIQKYHGIFDLMIQGRKMAKSLNGVFNSLNG